MNCPAVLAAAILLAGATAADAKRVSSRGFV
jgi:hypothetical protein